MRSHRPLHLATALSFSVAFTSLPIAAQDAPAAPDAPAETPADAGGGDQSYLTDEDYEIGSLFEKSGIAMEDAAWEKALFYVDRIVEEYGEGAATTIGPKFGVMQYRRGFCLSRLEKYPEALEAYRACIDKYPNKPDTKAEERNPVIPLAVLESAAIKQRQGNHEEAIALYEEFQSLEPDDGLYSKAFFYIELGTCYVKSGKLEKGLEIIDKAFASARSIGASPKDLFRGFLSLVEGWVNAEDSAADVERGALEFMDKHGSSLALSAYDKARFSYNPRILGFAGNASEKGMSSLALRLYGLVSSASDVVDDLEARAAGYAGGAPPALTTAIDEYSALASSGTSDDVIGLMGLAGTYQRMGNFRVPFAIYSHLEKAFPDNPNRQHAVFGALQCSSAIGDTEGSIAYGNMLLAQFPDYEHKGAAVSLMLQKLFFSQQYAKSLELAEELKAGLEPGSDERDMADFIHAGSHFYLGNYADSLPALKEHIDTYPDSQFHENARRLEGVGFVIRQMWNEAAPSLDKFMKDFPDSDFMDGTILDRATTHYQLSQYDESLKMVQKMRLEHAGSEMLDRALNLGGDVHFQREELEPAQERYSKALELATANGHKPIGAHAVSQLLSIAISQEDNDTAVAMYDKYFAEYAPSVYDSGVAVSALAPLKAAGRIDQGFQRLEEVIATIANTDDAGGLERAINSYVEKYAEEKGAKAAYDQLIDFPLHGKPQTASLDVWLLVSRVDLLEDENYKADFKSGDAARTVAYDDLSKFDLGILAPYVLNKLGRNLREKGNPEMAIPYFQEVIKRDDPDYTPVATLGLAQINARSADKAVQDKALTDFDTVIAKFEGTNYAVEAKVDKGVLLYDQKRWKEAADVLLDVYQNHKQSGRRAEIAFKAGRGYQEAGQADQALQAYQLFFSAPLQGILEYSAEARVRAAEMKYASGDKEAAFTLITDTATRMHKLQNDPADKGQWLKKSLKLYKQWQAELGKQPDFELEKGIEFP